MNMNPNARSMTHRCETLGVALSRKTGCRLTIAHNIARELQIAAAPGSARNTVHSAALWTCQKLSTLRRQLLWQPARLLRPNGKSTLALGAKTTMKERFHGFWYALNPAQAIVQ